MSEEELKDKKNQVVDVLPLKKGRRMLVFLADLVIGFILTFLFFNLAVMPLGKVFTNYDSKNSIYETNVENMHTILYKNNLIKISPDYSKDDIDLNIEYTYNCWLSYYVLDDETSINPNYPEYGHKISNDVIYHYYHDILSDDNSFKELFNKYNADNGYFTISGDLFILKDNIKNELNAYFNPGNEMGDVGEEYYNNIQTNVFTSLLSEIFTDIEVNHDLTYETLSYQQSQKVVNEISTYHDNLLIVTTVISYVLSWSISFIIVPMFNKNRKTIAMMMMRIERINLSQLYICHRSEIILYSLYALFTNLFVIFFIPVSYVSFNYLFSLTWLLYLSLVSLLLSLASMVVVLINSFNRSISDIASKTVLITTADLDNIYRAKGYNI